MNQERLMKVLVGPIVSEKSTMIGEKHNQYSFVVVPDAKKSEVKAAVELLFKVQVSSVQILNLKGKQKRFGRVMGKRNDVRKAYVSLAKDSSRRLPAAVMRSRLSTRSSTRASPGPLLLRRRIAAAAAITMVTSPAVIRAVVPSVPIASSTSSVIRTVSPPALNALNTIRTVPPILLSCFTPTANVVTSLPRRA